MNYKNILIIQTAFLGDVILITPLIRAVKNIFPKAQIDVLIVPQYGAILKNNPYIRNIIGFDKRKNKVKAFWRTLRILRKNHYDMAIAPHSSVTTAYLMLLAGIRERVGFDRWHAAKYLTIKTPHPDGVHKIERLLQLVTPFSDKKFDIQTEIFPGEKEISKAKELLSEYFDKEKKLIAVAPGSVWFTKRWPQEHYIKLSEILAKEEYILVFLGAPDEREICRQIIDMADVKALNLAGTTSIPESAAVIALCDLMICNDSGPLHIANAVQTDVFAFFGPTTRKFGYYPYRKGDKVFEIDLDCRPCGSHGSNECPLGHFKCMREISPLMVAEEINKKLKVKI